MDFLFAVLFLSLYSFLFMIPLALLQSLVPGLHVFIWPLFSAASVCLSAWLAAFLACFYICTASEHNCHCQNTCQGKKEKYLFREGRGDHKNGARSQISQSLDRLGAAVWFWLSSKEQPNWGCDIRGSLPVCNRGRLSFKWSPSNPANAITPAWL